VYQFLGADHDTARVLSARAVEPEAASDYVFTRHASDVIARRGLSLATVQTVLTAPEQRIELGPGRAVLQSRITDAAGRAFLLLPDKQGREVLEEPIVKVSYDSRTDIVTVVLRDGVPVAESDEDKPGVILDYDERGNLVAVEILDASQRVTDARRVEFQMTE